MATTGIFRYVRPPLEVFEIVKQFAKDHHPDLTLSTATEDQRVAVFQEAMQAGLLVLEKEVSVHSIREHKLSIDHGGAQLCPAPSHVNFQSADFQQPIVLEAQHRTESQLAYYAEVEQIARRLLGPKVVHAWCTSHILRVSAGTTAVGETAGPIRFVHNDFTEEYDDVTRKNYTTNPTGRAQSLRKTLKHLKGLEFSEAEMSKYRLVVLNTWRPITLDPLRRDPLAVCDNRSINKADLQRRRTDIAKKNDDPDDDYALEIYASQHSPDHKWHYVPDFTSQELLVFKTFDSEMHPFIPTMHSAFDLPDQEGAPPRHSCEARVVCLLEKDAVLSSRL